MCRRAINNTGCDDEYLPPLGVGRAWRDKRRAADYQASIPNVRVIRPRRHERRRYGLRDRAVSISH